MTTPLNIPSNADEIRNTVSRAYANALNQTESSCCGPTCCDGAAQASPTAGVASAAVDYGDLIDETTAQAASQSFGCGNPLAFAGVEPGQTVVDLGSGAGLDLLIAARKVGPEGRAIGIDMTREMLAAAQRNIEAAGVENAEVRQGLIEDLPVEDHSADWIISNCVINLSPDKPAVFREIARVLRPGGQFSISDIVAEELPETIRERAAAYSACIGGAISESEYLDGLRAAGLEDLDVTERIVYDASQLRALVSSDLSALGMSDAELEDAITAVAGKVWSARIIGRRPEN